MFEGLSIIEITKLLLPVIIIEIALKAFCIYLIAKNGVKNLSRPIWVIIVLVVSTIGSVSFLLFGRREYYND